MQTHNSKNLAEIDAKLYANLKPLISEQRLVQSLLLVGSKYIDKESFALQLVSLCLCENNNSCGSCKQCALFNSSSHPDFYHIKPIDKEKNIKIDAIRELQQNVHNTTKCATSSYIIIDTLDKLTTGAINALLKILEEPPKHVKFILLAEHIATIPATISSRCHKYYFTEVDFIKANTLVETKNIIIQGLNELLEKQVTPVSLSTKLQRYALWEVLDSFYLIIGEIIKLNLYKNCESNVSIYNLAIKLSDPIKLIAIQKSLIGFMLKLKKDVNFNISLLYTSIILDLISNSFESP